jgi:exonuclease III
MLLLQPESRERYQRLLAQGWTDSVRARYPDERIYSTPYIYALFLAKPSFGPQKCKIRR